MGKVVVGLDGSEASRLAFHAAVSEAELRGHRVRALHVCSYPVTTVYQVTQVDITDVAHGAEAWLDEELAELEASYPDGFPVPVEPIVSMGHAGTVLVEEAGEGDLLVVGSRGLGGVRSMFLGSVSTFCIHHLRSPVLVIPAPPDDDPEAAD